MISPLLHPLRWLAFAAQVALAAFSPCAAQPVLRLLPEPPPARLELAWDSTPAAWYQIEVSADLHDWHSCPPGPFQAVATREARHFDPPPPGAARFFRLRQTTPPLHLPTIEPWFIQLDPDGARDDLTLENVVLDLLARAAPGSTVRGSIYTWTRTRMSHAFIDAAARGVDVRLIVGSDHPAIQLLRAGLPPGHLIACPGDDGPGSCHGTRINHNKFLTFSRLLDGSTDIVVQSSANFTQTQLRQANHLLVFRRHSGLHALHLAYWQDLARALRTPDYGRAPVFADDLALWFSPCRSAEPGTGQEDPVVSALSDFVVGPGSSIHIAMAFWSDARPAIARRLVELRRAGALVNVILSPDGAGPAILALLREGGVEVTLLDPVHSKYLLVHSMPRRQPLRLVYAGSHNYTAPALRENDETLMRIAHEPTYAAFLEDWRRLRAHPRARQAFSPLSQAYP